MNKAQKIMLSLVMIAGFVLIVILGSSYLSETRTLSSLKKELADSTAAWKQINEDKLVVQKELKAVKAELRDAELTVSESEERAASLESDIASLEAEIETMKMQLGSEN
jgi:peptidoglycan hydrolase CwlO-like protein